MDDTFFIRPAIDGARLHDPVTNEPLAAAGETKPRTSYWLMCLNRGDVVEGEVKTPVAPAPKPAAMATTKPLAAPVL